MLVLPVKQHFRDTVFFSKVDIKGTLVVSGGCKAKHLTAPSLTVTDDGDRELCSQWKL